MAFNSAFMLELTSKVSIKLRIEDSSIFIVSKKNNFQKSKCEKKNEFYLLSQYEIG